MGFFTRKRRKRWRTQSESHDSPPATEEKGNPDLESEGAPFDGNTEENAPNVHTYTREEFFVRSEGEASGQRVQGILDSLIANICVVDSEGTIIAVNQAWNRFAAENNYKADKGGFIGSAYGIGKNYFAVCNEATGEDITMARAAAQGLKEILNGDRERFSMEYPCHSPEVHRWFLLTISPIVSQLGGAIISHFNITEQTELRQENKTLDAFAQSLALAFRTPLGMMRTNLDSLLFADSLPPALQTNLRQLTENVHQLDSMVRDLLAYGRIGRSNILLRPVDLSQAVQEALSYHAVEIKQKNAHISTAESYPYVLADPVLLAETLSCLISNSLKFVLPGEEPEITIYAENRPDAVWVWVEDCGIGIDPKDHAPIFMIFHRGEGSNSYPGNGIGLAIVERSMKQMKGFIEVLPHKNQQERGTRLKLIFPKRSGRSRQREAKA